jgi:hypothetical protein
LLSFFKDCQGELEEEGTNKQTNKQTNRQTPLAFTQDGTKIKEAPFSDSTLVKAAEDQQLPILSAVSRLQALTSIFLFLMDRAAVELFLANKMLSRRFVIVL